MPKDKPKKDEDVVVDPPVEEEPEAPEKEDVEEPEKDVPAKLAESPKRMTPLEKKRWRKEHRKEKEREKDAEASAE